MLPNIVEDVVVAGDFAYVAAGAAGLRVINVANPAQPAEVGFYEALDAAKGVAVAGTTAYVADEDAGLVTVNVADPANPTLLGMHSPAATGVAVAGNIAYLADGPGGHACRRHQPTAPVGGARCSRPVPRCGGRVGHGGVRGGHRRWLRIVNVAAGDPDGVGLHRRRSQPHH